MTTAPSGSVAVGVDQSAGARTALERAAAEAELRGLPLRIAGSWNNLDHELPEGYQQQPCTRPPSRPPPGPGPPPTAAEPPADGSSTTREPATTMQQYELRAEHRPVPGGGRRVHMWHVVRAEEQSGLCGYHLAPDAESGRIADLEDLPGQRCESCRTAYRSALPPPD